MGSSKIKFFVGEPEKRTVIQIQREGCRFYRMELDKLLPIGDIFETIRFLYRYNAELAVEKGNRLKPRAFFFNRETAMEALKEGFPVLLSGPLLLPVFGRSARKPVRFRLNQCSPG